MPKKISYPFETRLRTIRDIQETRHYPKGTASMPKKLLQRFLPNPHKIKEIKSLAFLGDRLHSPNLWHLNRRSVSRAFAIGLWAMYTPPLPWQQVIAAIGAIYFNANLPIAVALVWITNPLTWLPMYYFAYQVGALAMGSATFSFDQFSQLFNIETAMELGAPLLLGCLILMHIGAVAGYFGIQWLWRQSVRHALLLRKFRSSPFDSAVMVRESYSTYKKFIGHHTHLHEPRNKASDRS
jgi:uncharacterized protein (DUF2062 family)